MQWARLQTDLNIQLRRGAWYRIRLLGALEAVIEVRGRQLQVPTPFIEVIGKPPRKWTVVSRPRDAVHLPPDWGDRYAVCPSCRERQQIVGRPRLMTCQRCRAEFYVGWKEWAGTGPGLLDRVLPHLHAMLLDDRNQRAVAFGTASGASALKGYEVLRRPEGRGGIIRVVARL